MNSEDANTEIKNYTEKVREQEKKLKEFDSFLSQLGALEIKKKLLWKHIYEHAMEDRTHAFMLFTELYTASKGSPSEHHLNGPVLAKYIERMSRANDQILKLAELIQNAQSQEAVASTLSEGEIFDIIKKGDK